MMVKQSEYKYSPKIADVLIPAGDLQYVQRGIASVFNTSIDTGDKCPTDLNYSSTTFHLVVRTTIALSKNVITILKICDCVKYCNAQRNKSILLNISPIDNSSQKMISWMSVYTLNVALSACADKIHILNTKNIR